MPAEQEKQPGQASISKHHSYLHGLSPLRTTHPSPPGGSDGWRVHFHHEHEEYDGAEHHRTWSVHDLNVKERIRHFTWSWYTMTMATGGIANVLASVPQQFRFPGLYTIGCAIMLLNIALFILTTVVISIRFYFWPETFKYSFLHPTESLFIPAVPISIGTILVNISQYALGDHTGTWLDTTMMVLFWFYCALAMALSLVIYLILWSTQTFTIAQMTPVWIFPAYPVLLAGPLAAQLAKWINPASALTIVFGGFILQGIGFMVSFMIYSAYLYRLMTQKLPTEALRPGMFISIGPSGFTVSGLIGMSQQLPRLVDKDFMGPDMGEFAAKVTIVITSWIGVWLWGLAIWFFFISVGAHFSCIAHGRMHFAMNWYSFVFPNTALTTATFAVSTALGHNRGFALVGCCLAAAIVATWLFVLAMMCRAVYLRQILWPQMQEDRDEGGWGRSGHKVRLKASLLPPGTVLPEGAVPDAAGVRPVAIESVDSSGVPVVVSAPSKDDPPVAVPA